MQRVASVAPRACKLPLVLVLSIQRSPSTCGRSRHSRLQSSRQPSSSREHGQERQLQHTGHGTNCRSCGGERLTECCGQECKVTDGRCSNGYLELRKYRYFECYRLSFAVLVLCVSQPAARMKSAKLLRDMLGLADMLTAKECNVGPARAEIQQQAEGKAGFRSDWKSRLELTNLLDCPRRESG
jgi:hypothetical protein